MAAHHEVHFEQYITEQLVNNGWKEGHSCHYDQQRALYPQDVMDWVKATQPDAWHKLNKLHGVNAEQVLLERLEKPSLPTKLAVKQVAPLMCCVKALPLQVAARLPWANANPKMRAMKSV